MNSQISKFYKLSKKEKINTLKEHGFLTDEMIAKLQQTSLPDEIASHLVENQISQFSLPLGVALNFKINQKDYIVPMATEEPSVIAASSHAAKLALPNGFTTSAANRLMLGQIICYDAKNTTNLEERLAEIAPKLQKIAEQIHPSIVKRGGGFVKITSTLHQDQTENYVTFDISIDTKDAMGANIINSILEGLAPHLAELIDGKILMSILSNLPLDTIVTATCDIPIANLAKDLNSAKIIANKIVKATNYAKLDPKRAATHNKGVMNGIEAVVLATGNDTRAIAAAAYTYANNQPLTNWKIDGEYLHGTIKLPLAIGTVGGAINILPMAKLSLEILQNPSAKELAQIIAAVGLAQNFAALKALVSEGIQRGHMSLHAQSVAIQAGAVGEQINLVVAEMIKNKNINPSTATEILKRINK